MHSIVKTQSHVFLPSAPILPFSNYNTKNSISMANIVFLLSLGLATLFLVFLGAPAPAIPRTCAISRTCATRARTCAARDAINPSHSDLAHLRHNCAHLLHNCPHL